MKNKGFTLIELVVVIVVLSILAVTAAPKFLNIQSEARVATLSGAKGALQGANAIIFGKAAIEGIEKGHAEINIEGESVNLIDGLPIARLSSLDAVWNSDLYGYDSEDGISVVYGLKENNYQETIDGGCYLLAENEAYSSVPEDDEPLYTSMKLFLAIDGC
ncbi:prepilin-type N-terminal cleavage/methylation domain-containing protein [Photobacterium makurazakiensis]|uniref:prepilin-type N-terminal cleavage/methylation domain-containing protein n=1 Tax=Photobacterium makurazakiensis TaxID=2910234 RepID=UPI003D09ED55